MNSTPLGNEPVFGFWIVRLPDPEGPLAVRFSMEEGKGILRLARPGIWMEPPAREKSIENRLSPELIRTGRFIHTWRNGGLRQTWLLSRLEEGQLESLPWHTWVQLVCESENGQFFLSLPEHFSDSLPALPDVSEEDDLLLGIGEAEEELEGDLLALGEAEPVVSQPLEPMEFMEADTWAFDTDMVAGLVEAAPEATEEAVAIDDGFPSEEITALKPPPRPNILPSMTPSRHIPLGIERATLKHLQQQLQEAQERNRILEARVRELEIRIAQMVNRR